ncbi:hypothetical protein, partial [Amycolatopsis lurida]|uniref:hypothetical protein n=1 Tax=Amycolatopsis lurida TaxID=31959 RepID=UPI003658F6C7
MTVPFPRDLEDTRYELYLSTLGWVDITSDVLARDGVQISRGYTSERAEGAASPQSCQLTLQNRDGKYSPKNPLGVYYGQFRQNTPLRVSTCVVRDQFGRTVSNGWGTSDTGDSWTRFSGSAGDFSVSGGKGIHVVTVANTHRLTYIPGLLFRDVEIRATCSSGDANVTGGVLAPLNLVVGGLSTSDYFMLTVTIDAAEVIYVRLNHVDGTSIAPTTALAFPNTGQTLAAALQLEGQSLRGKVWDAAGPEPYEWDIEGGFQLDQYIDRAPGWVGIRSATGTGNTDLPVTYSYDNFEIRLNRFHGEVAAWPSQWDTSGNDVYVPIEAAGLRRRLSQGSDPLVSPYLRGNITFSPPHVSYYPVEDESGSDSIASGLPNAGPMQISGSGTVQLAADSSFAGSAPIGKPSGTRWISPRFITDATGEAQLMFLLSTPFAGETGGATLAQFGFRDGTLGYCDVTYIAGGLLRLNFYTPNRAFIGNTSDLDPDLDGNPKLISVEFRQNGANLDWLFCAVSPVGGGPLLNGALASRTLGAPDAISISPYSEVSASAIGHVAVRTDIVDVFSLGNQLLGYAGEGAQERIERLCRENDGINNTFIRSSILAGTAVGVQGRKTLLDLLDEAVKADLGYLNESRDIIGFVQRYGRSLYNQAAVLTLDYAAGQVQPPFGQVDDDMLITNDFTAKRASGSSYRATQETGPLAVTSPTTGQGVGRYPDSDEYNVATDDQLPDIATWKVHVGTNDEPRYPRVTVNLAKLALVSK